MNKYLIPLVILICLLTQTIFGGYFTALLIATGWFKNFKLFQPQTPVVIERTTEVVTKDFGDLQSLYADTKDFLVDVTAPSGKVLGLLLSNDGVIVVPKELVIGSRAVLHDGGKDVGATVIAINKLHKLSYLKADEGFNQSPDFLNEDKLVLGLKLGVVSGPVDMQVLKADYLSYRHFASVMGAADFSSNIQPMLYLQNGNAEFSVVAAHEGKLVGVVNADKMLITNRIFSYDLNKIAKKEALVTYSALGVNVKLVDGKVFVSKQGKELYLPGSMATILQEGDQIVSVNQYREFDEMVDQVLADEDGVLDIVYLRGGKENSASIKSIKR